MRIFQDVDQGRFRRKDLLEVLRCRIPQGLLLAKLALTSESLCLSDSLRSVTSLICRSQASRGLWPGPLSARVERRTAREANSSNCGFRSGRPRKARLANCRMKMAPFQAST